MKCFLSRFLILVWFVFLLVPCSLFAEETGSNKNVFNLGEVVIQGQSDTITRVSTVETVDLDAIEMTNATDIAQAIATVPGVTFSSGGNKASKSINVRGFGSKYVPIFYDGIPLYIPNYGSVEAGNLTTDNVARVDVSKGVSSVLYGFNTMGGVINIVSRKPQKEFEGSYGLEISDNGAYKGKGNIGSKMEKHYLIFGGGFTDSDGWELSEDFDATTREDGGERDNSDLKEWNISAKAGWTPIKGHEYAIGLQTIQREKGLPTTSDPTASRRQKKYWRFTDWDKQTLYFIGNTKLSENLLLRTRVFHDKYYNLLEDFSDNTYTAKRWSSTHDDHSFGGSIVIRTTFIPKNTLSASFHYKKDIHEEQDDTGDPWEKYEQEMVSIGLEDDVKLSESFALIAGVSCDIQHPLSAYDGTTNGFVRDTKATLNPQIGFLWTAMEDLDLHFSVGMKSRWPTLGEVYSAQMDRNTIANPDLSQEVATNWEIGFEKELPKDNSIGISLFYSGVDDLIQDVLVSPDTYQKQNVDESVFQGVEVNFASYRFPGNDLVIHYTYLNAENTSENAATKRFDGISEHTFYISNLYRFNDIFSVFGRAEYNSERYDNDGVDVVDGFWVADLKVMAKIHKLFNLEVGVKNLFDLNYEMEKGYPMEGRTFFAGVKGEF